MVGLLFKLTNAMKQLANQLNMAGIGCYLSDQKRQL
jgi:hypothetical protein